VVEVLAALVDTAVVGDNSPTPKSLETKGGS
jgi:hypothetical protein